MMDNLSSGIQKEVSKVVVGRSAEVESILECLLARGHALLEGAPGTSKTLLARSFAKSIGLQFKRVQFTPDMLPLDIVGGFVYNQKDKDFEFKKGPVFTNILLADEVNRAPPKVQSALLEAMQELQVTVEGHTEALPSPMIVVGTENPLEYQGVYPLPEGLLDRFMMKVGFDYQPVEVETAVLRRNLTDLDLEEVRQVTSRDQLVGAISEVQKVSVTEEILSYLARVAKVAREDSRLELGPSPRAMVQLLHCAQAKAAIEGRDYVTPDDLKQRARVVLAHRVRLSRAAVLKGAATDAAAVIAGVFDEVEPPR
jgi:MoxR-like ATPase